MRYPKAKHVKELTVNGKKYKYCSLKDLDGVDVERLPFSIRILLENILRSYDGFSVTDEHIESISNWSPDTAEKDIPYKPARILMQDFTGVPAVVDVASLRSEYIRHGKDGSKINPAIPVDLVIDHSVQVDYYGTDYAYDKNVEKEFERNRERYELLKWGQSNLSNFTVVPPGKGICHQVNLEYLSKGVQTRGEWLIPDTLVGTDSHTPMVNGIGVIAWGVGGIEAEAALLGQPIYIMMPEVVGLKLTGEIPNECTATDLVLSITRLLRDTGVVGKFVEVFGDGLENLSVTDRATISNMSPEFGCTVTYFPIDERTLEYMRITSRTEEQIEIVKAYSKENLLWRTGKEKIEYSRVVELDLSTLEPTVSGPKRPQDKIFAKDLGTKFQELMKSEYGRDYLAKDERPEYGRLVQTEPHGNFTYSKLEAQDEGDVLVDTENSLRSIRIKEFNREYKVSDGYIAIAAITSCTNTSNPAVMVGAGLLARNAVEKGLRTKSWVKTSLAPGSRVVTKYLERSGLNMDLDALRFHTVGYGCTSCIGNSGPLLTSMQESFENANMVFASVLSGNRNFEARVHAQVRMNFLMSPMLVVAYALAGRVDINLIKDPIDYDPNGNPVYLKDLWPSRDEIRETINKCVTGADFDEVYDEIFDGTADWEDLEVDLSNNDYQWKTDSTYIKEAPFFENLKAEPDPVTDIEGARVLLYLGDSVTTDHISPAGGFRADSAAGKYLVEHGIAKDSFNSYGSRRGNHEVMMRGTFANVRIKNKITDKEGGYSRYLPTGEVDTVFDVSMKYQNDKTPLIILAGKEYGSGSSRDWAAKGTFLLGVKAVIAESFERIHRSNLVQMGIAPLQFIEGENPANLGLDGTETYSISGLEDNLTPHKLLDVKAVSSSGKETSFKVMTRIDAPIEVEYYKNDGILQYVLREFLKEN